MVVENYLACAETGTRAKLRRDECKLGYGHSINPFAISADNGGVGRRLAIDRRDFVTDL